MILKHPDARIPTNADLRRAKKNAIRRFPYHSSLALRQRSLAMRDELVSRGLLSEEGYADGGWNHLHISGLELPSIENPVLTAIGALNASGVPATFSVIFTRLMAFGHSVTRTTLKRRLDRLRKWGKIRYVGNGWRKL